MKLLHKAIQIYDIRCGKNYLIVFGTKKKTDYRFVQLIIKQSFFWHLLGCVLEPDSNKGKSRTYLECKTGTDVSSKISSIHSFSEIQEKYLAMQNVFDFVEKAPQIKIGYTFNCPEEYIFKIGSGNETGIIGYDYPNTGSNIFLLPKSSQLKPISKISKTTYRIFFNIKQTYW